MSRYRVVPIQVWLDEEFQALSDYAKLLLLYLLTNPDTTSVPGLFRSGRAQIAEALEWLPERFQGAFAELSEAGLVRADFKRRVVWVEHALEWAPPPNPNVVKSWIKHLDEIPACELKDLALQALASHLASRGEPFSEPFQERFPKLFLEPLKDGSRNKEQEQEQEKEAGGQGQGATRQPSADDLFQLYDECRGRLPRLETINEARRRAARAALKEGTLDQWRLAFQAAARDDFYVREKHGFDVITRPKHRARWLDAGVELGALPDSNGRPPLPLPALPGAVA